MNDEDIKKIIEKVNYSNPIRYISGNIIEYDIKAANISMLYDANIITREYYEYLSYIPKNMREREIGLMELKDPKIYECIAAGIKKYKLLFAKANNVKEREIVRVANDAVYINRSLPLSNTVFGNIVFKVSSPANVYMKLLDLCIFAYIPINGNLSLDIKGINDKVLYLFQNNILNIIGTVIYLVERSNIQDAVSYLSGILDDYINKRLPVEYYREFNSNAMYNIIVDSKCYYIMQDYGFSIDDLDINYNLYILRELWGIILEIYSV